MPYGIARGLQCPRCGGKTGAPRTGRANDGAIFIRARKCEECDYYGHTAESWIPDGETNIDRLDEEIRWARMQRDRRLRGYRGIQSGHPTSVDKLHITIRVLKGTPRRRTS